jgi:Icc-related predicted phosphoesterase
MKLTFISDTHSSHQNLILEGGDILFHCGDFTRTGTIREAKDFAIYIANQKYRHKIVIAGNHDFCFENQFKSEAEKILKDNGIIYLNDSFVVLEKIKIWGSPVQPFFHNWAFNRLRGEEINKHWNLIPEDINILLTHGPPHGLLDKVYSGESVGCEDLLKKIAKVQPHIHAFGHIHESYGTKNVVCTRFINACVTDLSYKVVNKPFSMEYDP